MQIKYWFTFLQISEIILHIYIGFFLTKFVTNAFCFCFKPLIYLCGWCSKIDPAGGCWGYVWDFHAITLLPFPPIQMSLAQRQGRVPRQSWDHDQMCLFVWKARPTWDWEYWTRLDASPAVHTYVSIRRKQLEHLFIEVSNKEKKRQMIKLHPNEAS